MELKKEIISNINQKSIWGFIGREPSALLQNFTTVDDVNRSPFEIDDEEVRKSTIALDIFSR